VAYARQSAPSGNEAPTVNDHWHVSYGFYGCDKYLPNLIGNKEDPVDPNYVKYGIHSHDDGVIHWHPSGLATGSRAKFGLFLTVYGIKLSDDKIEFPADQGGAVYEEGVTKCTDADGKSVDGEIVVYAFDAFDTPDKYKTYITNFDDVRLSQDGMAFSVVFAPAGSKAELPPSAASLPELGAADGGTSGQTTSTVAGASTVPGESTTTVAGATTAPGATTVPSSSTTTAATTVAPAGPTTTAG
jgi:hypothetical protein